MAVPADIATAAREWVGVPYLHQGRSKAGVDCVGLLIVIAHALGLSDFDIDGYSRNPSGMMMRNLLKTHLYEIDMSEAGPGDILHIRYDQQPQHIAIISRSRPMYVIHADSLEGRVVEHRLDNYLRNKVRGCYRAVI